MTLHVVIERGEDGHFAASCPGLNGCWSQGRTREEALANIHESIDLYLEPSPAACMAQTMPAGPMAPTSPVRVGVLRGTLVSSAR